MSINQIQHAKRDVIAEVREVGTLIEIYQGKIDTLKETLKRLEGAKQNAQIQRQLRAQVQQHQQ